MRHENVNDLIRNERDMSETPRLIGIAGPSASGKTYLATALLTRIEATVVRCDDYYRDHSDLDLEARAHVNYDHPESIEYELIVDHLRQLTAGEVVECPTYDFAAHARLEPTQRREPAPIVLIDGIHVLHVEDVRELCDLRIYVHAEHDICLERRLARDVTQRGRTPESVVKQYERSVRPMCDQFVRPSRRHADIVVDGRAPITGAVATILDALASL